MKVLRPIIAVLALIVAGGVLGIWQGTQMLVGVILPTIAFLVLIVGIIRKVIDWAKSPVPFKIPTTCGQAKSLSFIKEDRFECPNSKSDVIVRMFLEIFLFRSLFRNTSAGIKSNNSPKLHYGPSLWLWLFGILFHYTFLIIVLRHLRLFTEPVLPGLAILEYLDGFVQIGAPVLYQSNIIFMAALVALFVRRLVMPQVRYISLGTDYFPLLLIFAIGATGMLMRHYFRVDVTAVKGLTMGLVTLNWTNPGTIHPVFFIHVTLVSTLMLYFPFSKLMHAGGIFFSPTRNMANDSRAKRHINPWNDPNIKPHSYAAYEDDFREFMVEADIPVDKELPPAPAAEKKEEVTE
ncbi:MAG: sulfate reduction electron transfer complex DsrMKJOP subunit DsrM [Desulfurivibrionaceae bacterium]|nr:sulfate reduction electron transfer complex DsrMKJOP subunit DsrM [Desulfurivibrionaceae bacterium]